MAKIPHALIIMDGIGWHEEQTDAHHPHNAVLKAHTPNLDTLIATCPNARIVSYGQDVGLPVGQFGNSEVGHMNLGAGRILYQDISKIDHAIATGEFFSNPILTTIDGAKNVHVIGVLSDGGVHGHINHIIACAKLASDLGACVHIHAILDGRDTPPKSALQFVKTLENALSAINADKGKNIANLATIIGRFYAMDRDNRWERVQSAYDLWVHGKGVAADSAISAIEQAYADGQSDEFIHGYILPNARTMQDGDALICTNFRADRARQFCHALLDKDFTSFARRQAPQFSQFITFTRYSDELVAKGACVAYEKDNPKNTLGEYLASCNKTQLRIAETEKYAHVTFFFSGGQEAPFAGESRILIDSPKVVTYDLCPQMSAYAITDALVKAIESGEFDALIVNFANGDMVGHTGDLAAAITAVETVDECLGRVIQAIKRANGRALITADHGNCELMYDSDTGQAHTQHTLFLVPIIGVGIDGVLKNGRLCDVAPTFLTMMGLDIPQDMQGNNLWHSNTPSSNALK